MIKLTKSTPYPQKGEWIEHDVKKSTLEPSAEKENALQGKYESRASWGKKHGFKLDRKCIGSRVLQNFT